jgi:hypothetical protein
MDKRDWFTTKDAANLANKRSRDNVIWINRDIRDLMMDKRGNVNGNILADLIAKCSDQFHNGWQIIKLTGKEHNAVKYCLVHENGKKRILKRDYDDDCDTV